MDEEQLDAEIARLELAIDLKRTEKFPLFRPYPKQQAFFAQGAIKRERGFLAGNRIGKTEAGAYEMTCHLTGLYPKDWPGKRFTVPIKAWCGGIGSTDVRGVMQEKLCGKPGDPSDFGYGLIPHATLIGRTLSHGVTDAFDSIRVRHVSGGTSVLEFKTYPQGRESWQGATVDVVWLDEEPPEDIYDEAKTRLTGPGIIYTTCTPLKGPTTFIKQFWPVPTSPDRGLTQMGLREVTHFTEEEKEKRLAGYSARERHARETGDPVLEGGAIFCTPESDLLVSFPFEAVPGFANWKKLWGVDFGFAHPFAAALCAIEPETNVFYVLRTLRMENAVPIMHATAIREIAINPPVAWPHDGLHTEKGTGEKLADIYRHQPCNLNMLSAHASHTLAGGFHVWPGLTEMDVAMRAGKFKVHSSCHEFFDEYRTYRSDEEGKIVKQSDDVLDAVRCAWMMRRYARPVPLGSKLRSERRQGMAQEIDPFTGRAIARRQYDHIGVGRT